MPTVVAPTSHHCPRCKVELTKIAVGGCPFEECAHCGGLWVDAGTFDHICADREAQTAAVDFKLPPPVPFDERVIYLKCPACSSLMNRENFAHRSGIIIDICKPHGIWLDRDCLRQVIEFIRAGGMDRARQIETEELVRQRALLEADQKVISHDDASMFLPSTRGEAGVNELIDGVASVIGWFLR
jgi:Zn-finger nucleic acid-binding protein